MLRPFPAALSAFWVKAAPWPQVHDRLQRSCFTAGQSLKDSVSYLPMIRTVRQHERWYSRDKRRSWCSQEAGVDVVEAFCVLGSTLFARSGADRTFVCGLLSFSAARHVPRSFQPTEASHPLLFAVWLLQKKRQPPVSKQRTRQSGQESCVFGQSRQ